MHMNFWTAGRALMALLVALLVACGGASGSSGLEATVSTLAPGATVQIVLRNTGSVAVAAPVVSLTSWLNSIALSPQLVASSDLQPGASVTLSFALATDVATNQALSDNYQYILSNPVSGVLVVTSNSFSTGLRPVLEVNAVATATYQTLHQDVLINADLWSDTAQIMSANYAFESIEGVGTLSDSDPVQAAVLAAGGTWERIVTANPPTAAYTTAATPSGVARAFGYPTFLADAMPVCFSWPVLPSSVSRKNFALTLNTGEVVKPYVTSIAPNLEFNERACVVLFGEFGNRLPPGTAGAVYPTLVTIVAGDSPLMLVGPSGPVSAVGLSKASGNPYLNNGGPTMNAAKLSTMSALGENAPVVFSSLSNNDCSALYGPSIQYRLRTFSTGGTAPDGVAAILPTDFGNYFRIQVTDSSAQVHWITQAGVPLALLEGNIEVVGLADLGVAGTAINDAYVSDRDNQIDICLRGSLAAMRLITGLDIPASGAYKRFYNPGGPGNDPKAGVSYTQPGAPQFLPVMQSLDAARTVNYP